MSGRASTRLAVGLAVVALVMEGASLFILTLNTAAFDVSDLGFNGVAGIVLGVTNPIIGWLIASRQRRNPIGWIFLIIGVSQATTGFFANYAAYGLVTSPGSLPGPDLAVWIQTWSWVPGFTGGFILLLLFPTGRPPSGGWRSVVGVGLAAGGLTVIGKATGSWASGGLAVLKGGSPDTTASSVGLLLLSLVGLAAVVSLAVRFHESGALERQQVKWFAAAAATEVTLVVLTSAISLPNPLGMIAAVVVIPLVPIATVVAVLRYRLYEIDRIISRTISWAITTGVIGALFVGVIVGLQGVLAPVTGGSTLAIAGSTLAAATLFQPLRRRVQGSVDRRFNRAEYNAQRTSDSFADHLRDEVDLATIGQVLLGAARGAVTPETAAVWLRRGPR